MAGIIGIGIDIVAIEKMAVFWGKHSERARELIFTPAEWQDALALVPGSTEPLDNPSIQQVSYLAERFAGKEAMIKVLGIDSPLRYEMNGIEVLGRTHLSIELRGPLAGCAHARGIQRIHGSCSSSHQHALACVIGEGRNE